MRVKHDLRYGGSVVGPEEIRAIARSVALSAETGNWQTGKEAAKMEAEAAKQLGVKHAILTTSGSSAGLLALAALELPRGSEVIIPSVTFPTIFNIILQCGLTPVVVDCKVGTYVIDVDKLEQAISKKTKALIAVHAVGNPCDMPRIMRIAKKHGIKVIEDNCDGWGTDIKGKKAGSFGDVSITSFHAAHIVSMGVGGGVFTNDTELAHKVRMYRDWGRQADINESRNTTHKSLPADYNPRFIYEKIGYNFQILELQAAMGRVQLKRAAKIKAARKKNAEYLIKKLAKHADLIMPETVKGAGVCWFALPLTCASNRGPLLQHLEANGIETRPMFAGDITKHPAYKNTKYRVGNKLTGCSVILTQSFWITVHPRLTKDDLDYIVSVFDTYYAARTGRHAHSTH